MKLVPGIYEQVINEELSSELSHISDVCKNVAGIDKAEASRILAQYLTEVVKQGLDNISDNGGSLDGQIALVNRIVQTIEQSTNEADFADLKVSDEAKQLLAVLAENDPALAIGKSASDIKRPETSIAQSSLFTGAIHEPQMYTELKREIASADRIEMLVSFIKWSGLRLIIDELREFTQNGGELKIITTSYMGATDIKAIEELSKLSNTSVKVSYDTQITRLHAKTYIFHRDTGYTTAYVGSSNLSNAAMSSGLEWNVKLTRHDLPETIDKIEATFESYWNSSEFEYYDEGQRERLSRALKAERYHDSNNTRLYTFDINPYSYQQEILDKLSAEREVRGHFRNLIVAATGTGKTIISALDYRRFCRNNHGGKCRLLFVAHREEILAQSINTFRAVLKDENFGSLWVGGYKPEAIDHLFISIQTFNSQNLASKTARDFYDYIIVDEFHHAAAKSYQNLLEYYEPKILLGLTATPERMDGRSILPYFNNRIAAEIRLPEAIDRKLLCPFQYFGITDTINLGDVRWRNGSYDKAELSNIYTLSGHIAEKRADQVIRSLLKYVTDIDQVKGLGFCVTVKHAQYMSDYFNEHGIASMCLTGESDDALRDSAKKKLEDGEVHFIFVVDIYNEGVDIPAVNTILFLRPTESLTVFLQQLGRGLRLCEGKDCLTVLDFIGQANKKYNFESKFASIIEDDKKNIAYQIKNGFQSAPTGCYIQLERLASEYVLNNIRASYGNTSGLISRAGSFKDDSGLELSLSNYLDYYNLDPRQMYRYISFSRLCVRAGEVPDFTEPAEDQLTKAMLKLCLIDSRRLISFLIDTLTDIGELDIKSLSAEQLRMLQMFYITVFGKAAEDWQSSEVQTNIGLLKSSPNMLHELIDLLRYKLTKIDFIDSKVELGFDCPLDLHCTYTRDQILVALDFMRPNTVREGVKWLPDKKTDILFVTLNKSDKDYSPTTMYNDYSINERLFHWQSQSTTAESSATGQRYIHHAERGSHVLLFVREYKNDPISGGAGAYTFLGPAQYIKHEGSRPMNVTWSLVADIPAKFIKKTNKLMVV